MGRACLILSPTRDNLPPIQCTCNTRTLSMLVRICCEPFGSESQGTGKQYCARPVCGTGSVGGFNHLGLGHNLSYTSSWTRPEWSPLANTLHPFDSDTRRHPYYIMALYGPILLGSSLGLRGAELNLHWAELGSLMFGSGYENLMRSFWSSTPYVTFVAVSKCAVYF